MGTVFRGDEGLRRTMKRKLFGKKDILLIGAVVILCVSLFAVRSVFFSKSLTGEVIIYQNGKKIAVMCIDRDEEIVIRGENGEENTVCVQEGSVFMKHSDCKNQCCVDQGAINSQNIGTRPLGNRIICLPNRVEIEAVTGKRDGIPDI